MGRDVLAGKRVVILGLARQGVALGSFLAQVGAEVTISDLRDEETLAEELAVLDGLPIAYVLGEHPPDMLDGVDLLCLSGGVPVDIPVVIEAKRRGIPLSNDAQIFVERCPARVIGITGSAGKTTTTSLTGEMCRAAGFRTWVGGNIGNPLIADLDEIHADDWVVMELSSFQLELMTTSPHMAAVLNITPNHLDRHETMEAYIAAKRNVVAYQKIGDHALLGYDDANARSLAQDTVAHLIWFSGRTEVEEGAFVANDDLILRVGEGGDRVICRTEEVQLRGSHNVLNVLAASALAAAAGISLETIREIATTFTGVEHRLEFVREIGGAQWFDDSIATAPERSLAALRSFEEPIVLLAGGRDKKLPWKKFADEAVQRVRLLVTFGEAGPMIAQKVGESRVQQEMGLLERIVEVETLEQAVEAAARLTEAGDVVLLSPGGTSFDAFADFAERGDRFRALVHELAVED